MTVFSMTNKLVEYDPEVLKKLHDIELMILSDFIEIVNDNNLTYFAAYGTALGAIRHEGFIPWDDDIDLLMFREDYDKLVNILSRGNTKYELFTMETTKKYFKTFGKFSLKGTKAYDFWQENTDFVMGINIDIFILDFVPKNKIKKSFYIKRMNSHRKWCWLLEVLNSDMYLSSAKEKIGHLLNKAFKLLGVNQKFLLNQNKRLRKYNKLSNNLYELYDGYFLFPKSLFEEIKQVNFESIEICIPKNHDAFLKIMYGDFYMQLPPENERFNHSGNVDFGEYG